MISADHVDRKRFFNPGVDTDKTARGVPQAAFPVPEAGETIRWTRP